MPLFPFDNAKVVTFLDMAKYLNDFNLLEYNVKKNKANKHYYLLAFIWLCYYSIFWPR